MIFLPDFRRAKDGSSIIKYNAEGSLQNVKHLFIRLQHPSKSVIVNRAFVPSCSIIFHTKAQRHGCF